MSKVISIDLEMNQPSDKIIQIGYVIADATRQKILLKRSLLVNPGEPLGWITNRDNAIHISDYTGITQDKIDAEGMELREAYDIMCEDIKKHNPTRTVIQWGDGKEDGKGDHDCLRRQLGVTWAEFIFRPRAWDVKTQFQIYRYFQRDGVASGLVKAMESLGLKFQGRPHDAADDAENTVVTFWTLGAKAVKYDQIKKLTE